MNDGPEHLLKVKKALKTSAVHEEDRVLLDLWQKNWRIAFIMPQFRYESAGVDEFMTSYRVYDCFINGRLFHSNSPEYNSIMHGMAKPDTLSQPSLYLQNIFHLTVSNLCLAAVGLKRYIDNKCTFDNIEMSPMLAMEFLFQRKRMDVLDEMYQELNKAIPEGLIHARWK
jgi:hypothetical protein